MLLAMLLLLLVMAIDVDDSCRRGSSAMADGGERGVVGDARARDDLYELMYRYRSSQE